MNTKWLNIGRSKSKYVDSWFTTFLKTHICLDSLEVEQIEHLHDVVETKLLPLGSL